MVADIGTKVLSAPRLQHLKTLLGMGQKGEEQGSQECDQPMVGQQVVQGQEKEEVKEPLAAIEGAQRILQLITLAVSLQGSRGQKEEDEEQGEEEWVTFYMFVVVYTIFILVVIHGVQWVSSFLQGRLTKKDQGEEDEKDQSESEDKSQSEGEETQEAEMVSRPPFLPSSSLTAVSGALKLTSSGQHQAPQPSMQSGSEERKEEVARPIGSISQPSSSNSQAQQLNISPVAIGSRVFTTKFGQVYHRTRNCHYLSRRSTGNAKEHQWCTERREKESKNTDLPRKEQISITTWGGLFHTCEGCSHFSKNHILAPCRACGK